MRTVVDETSNTCSKRPAEPNWFSEPNRPIAKSAARVETADHGCSIKVRPDRTYRINTIRFVATKSPDPLFEAPSFVASVPRTLNL